MKLRDLLLTFAAALMLSLARLPLYLGFLAFVGWIPLMRVLRQSQKSVWQLLAMGAIWSVTYVGIVYYWIGAVTPVGLIGIMIYYSLWLWLVCFGANRIYSRFPKLGDLGLISFIIAFEYLQHYGEMRFAWWDSGYMLADYQLLIQVADLGGMSLLALLILLANIFVDRLLRKKWHAGLALILLFGLWTGYGAWCLKSIPLQKRDFDIQVMQPSIPQEEKWEAAHYDDMIKRFGELSHKAARDGAQLLIWPEAAMPAYLKWDRRSRNDLQSIVNSSQLDIFTGFPDFDPAPPEHFDDAYYYNGASLFQPNGFWRPVYHKNILVPVGERMLWMDYLPFMSKLRFGQANWEFGTRLEYYESHGYRFSPSICYELAFGAINHRMAIPAKQAGKGWQKMDFLVNLTNDGWFGTSYGPWLHQVMTRFRAVENRIQIYRSANTGISVIVDPLGRELASAGLFQIKNIKAPLYTTPRIPLLRHIYLYPFIFVALAAILFLASLFWKTPREQR